MSEVEKVALVKNRLSGGEGSYRPFSPRVHGALGVCPLLYEKEGTLDYLTYEQALSAGTVTVTETTEAGTVPELVVENKGDRRVLIMDGEQLVGAKQNRIINTSVLVDAHSRVVIPVTCVEQGRWHYESSKRMKGSRANLYARTRARKSRQVAESLASSSRYNSNQAEVWHDISSRLREDRVASATSAMEDHYQSTRGLLEEFHDELSLESFETPDSSVILGAVFSLSGKIMGMDVFDRSSTLASQWHKLLNSYAIEALREETEDTIDVERVARFFDSVRSSEMRVFRPPGLGWDVRITGLGAVGSALAFDDQVVHLYAFSVNDSERSTSRGTRTSMSSFSERRRRRL